MQAQSSVEECALQPDQQPSQWDRYVAAYEEVFEPLTSAFAADALEGLCVGSGTRCLDVAAGAGGAALAAARRGAAVLAVDASAGMVARITERAKGGAPGSVRAAIMDGSSLDLPDDSLDAAFSIFGLILFPDPIGALREIRRVLAPGGRLAVVTWTEPERYELASRLIAAITAVRGPQAPPPARPAQLRYREEAAFRGLFESAGFAVEGIATLSEKLHAPSAEWLADRLAFAPGLAAMLSAQGEHRSAVLARFTADLERDQGHGPVALTAVACLGIARKVQGNGRERS